MRIEIHGVEGKRIFCKHIMARADEEEEIVDRFANLYEEILKEREGVIEG